jgi:hypothetical protein
MPFGHEVPGHGLPHHAQSDESNALGSHCDPGLKIEDLRLKIED